MKPDLSVSMVPVVVPLLRGVFIASALFSAILAVLLSATFVQTRLHDPVNSRALTVLVERSQASPADTMLRQQIRALDLLARKAYFTSQWQLQHGAVLLLIGLAVMLLCGKGIEMLLPVLPRKPDHPTGAWWKQSQLSRRALIITGSLMALFVLCAVVIINRAATPAGRQSASAPAAPSTLMQKNWPGFRGWEGIGRAVYDNVPVSWDGATGAGVRWKAVVALPGKSSPVVWNDRIFLTGGDKDIREVYCFNLKNGSLRWRYRVQIATDSAQAGLTIDNETGYAAPTAACDGQRVFAVFPTGELVCLDLNGRRVWERHLGVPDNHYGHSSSLITRDGMLYVQLDQYDTGRLLALSVATGKTVWQAARPRLSWASPVCVHTGERVELVCADNQDVVSYDPATGAVLWKFDCLYGEMGPSPAYASGRVYVANENAVAACISVKDTGAGDSARIVWKWNESLPSTSSPVADGRFLFLATSDGLVSCVGADSGKTIWTHDYGTGFYASPVIAGDRVYLMDRKGIMRIFAAADTFASLGDPALGEPSVATPALLDGIIIIRGEKNLYCVGEKGK